jgi:dimethylaniline monooxygenase (N-oxide forming)
MSSSVEENNENQETIEVVKKRVAIIGSGVSGILAIKACKEEEDLFSEIVCYEKTSASCGLWRYRESNSDNDICTNNNNNNHANQKISDTSSSTEEIVTVMHGTIANSSKEMSAFSDFPPSPDTPNFMHHKVMLKYIEDYANKFECLPHIQYRHEVVEISRASFQGKWKIHLRDHNDRGREKTEFFDAVLICTGHHGRPFIPPFPGINKFKGE